MNNNICAEIENSNYKWFYDGKRLDKIGINPAGTMLMHDSMVFKLVQFRKISKKINNINTVQLLYKISNKYDNNAGSTFVKDKDAETNRSFFTDVIFHEQSSQIAFKYVEHNGNMKFSHIVFNGKTFT